MSDPIISTAALAGRLGDGRTVVVDATWFMPGSGKTGLQSFETDHLPNAVFFDIDGVSDHSSPLPHMLPSPEAFTEAARAMGINRDAFIVVYDAEGVFSAPRVWWNFRVMGHEDVRVLDGGLPRWMAEGRPTEGGHCPKRDRGDFQARFDGELVRDMDAVRAVLQVGDQVVDARPAARFRGDAPEPRPGLRSGHMPGASNVPFNTLVENGSLLPRDRLQGLFAAARIDLDRPVTASCGSGVTAAVIALALARLGRSKSPIYDGSWAEWGSRDDTPVATGS